MCCQIWLLLRFGAILYIRQTSAHFDQIYRKESLFFLKPFWRQCSVDLIHIGISRLVKTIIVFNGFHQTSEWVMTWCTNLNFHLRVFWPCEEHQNCTDSSKKKRIKWNLSEFRTDFAVRQRPRWYIKIFFFQRWQEKCSLMHSWRIN